MRAAPSDDQSPLEVFERNVGYCNGLIEGGGALESMKVTVLDPADLYRAAWTQAVSAFDHCLHEELYARTPRLVRQGPASRPSKLSEVTLPFDLVDRIQNAEIEVGDAFGTHLRNRIGRTSFHQPEAISDAVRYVVEAKHGKIWGDLAQRVNHQVAQRGDPDPGWAAETAQHEHQRVLDRRNRIAHAADLDIATNQRTPMTGADARTAVAWMSDLGVALSGLMDARTP